MAFAGIIIEFYEDNPNLTVANEVINGRLVSSVEDTTVSTIETVAIPGNATYLTVYTATDCFIEIDAGTADAAAGRRAFLKSGNYRSFSLGPMTSAAKTIGYLAA